MAVTLGASSTDAPLVLNYDDLRDYCRLRALECEERFFGDNDSIKMCFLDSCFEPPAWNFPISVTLTVVYVVIFVFGVLGNLCVWIVSRSSSWIQNVTSDYLVNLAVADLFNLIAGLPFEVLLTWQQYPWTLPVYLCHFKGWLAETTIYVSVLTIVAFTLERYSAICRTSTLHRRNSIVPTRVNWIIVATWAFGGSCAIPYGVYHQVYTILGTKHWPLGDRYGPIEHTRMCMLPIAFDDQLYRLFRVIMHLSAIVFFGIPLLIILVSYVCIGVTIFRSRKTIQSFHVSQRRSKSVRSRCSEREELKLRHGKALVILTAVVAAFFVCYAPYNAQRLLFFWMDSLQDLASINQVLYLLSGVLFFLGSAVNPVLYNLISLRFRKACHNILTCHSAAATPDERRRRNGTLSEQQMILLSTYPRSCQNGNSSRTYQNGATSFLRSDESYSCLNGLRSSLPNGRHDTPRYGQFLQPPAVAIQGEVKFRERIRTV